MADQPQAGSANGQIVNDATNVGGAFTGGPMTVTDTPPEGVALSRSERTAAPLVRWWVNRDLYAHPAPSAAGGPLQVVVGVDAEAAASGTW